MITPKCHHFIQRRDHLEAEGITICQEGEARKEDKHRRGPAGSHQQGRAPGQKLL